MKIDFVTVVWGNDFVDLFLSVCLPSQLTSNNLPALPIGEFKYIIYSETKHFEAIKTDKCFSQLERIGINVELRPIEFSATTSSSVEKYNRLTHCHSHALSKTSENNDLFSWLVPDGYYPDGFFKSLWKLKNKNPRLIVAPWVRVEFDNFLTNLQRTLTIGEQNNRPTPIEKSSLIKNFLLNDIKLSTRELVRLTIKTLHPITRSLFVGTEPSSDWPANIYYQVPHGIIAKHFHLHPILMKPMKSENIKDGTLDSAGFFASQGFTNKNTLSSDDSDENLWFVEISTNNHQLTERVVNEPLNHYRITSWAEKHSDELQKSSFFKINFKFHWKEIDESWNVHIKAAEQCYRNVNKIRKTQMEALREVTHLYNQNREYVTETRKELNSLRAERHEARVNYDTLTKNTALELNSIDKINNKLIEQVAEKSEQIGILKHNIFEKAAEIDALKLKVLEGEVELSNLEGILNWRRILSNCINKISFFRSR